MDEPLNNYHSLCYCGSQLQRIGYNSSRTSCKSCFNERKKESITFDCNNGNCCYKQVTSNKYWICSECFEFEKQENSDGNEMKNEENPEKEEYDLFMKRINVTLNIFSYVWYELFALLFVWWHNYKTNFKQNKKEKRVNDIMENDEWDQRIDHVYYCHDVNRLFFKGWLKRC